MKKFLLTVMSAWAFSGCITDGDLNPCPTPASGVDVSIYVERFNGSLEPGRSASVPLYRSVFETSESCFGDRIEKLYYLLYRDGTLVEDGIVQNPSLVRTSHYMFKRDDLVPGRYTLYLMANCPDLEASPVNPDEITVAYPGHDLTADYFMAYLPFTVNKDSRASYVAQLKRLHGIVRFTFYDLDPSITKIDIHMDGLTGSGCILGTYSDDYEFNISVPVNPAGRAGGDTQSVVGLFPTTDGGVSSWDVKVHRADGEPLYFEGIVSRDLNVMRNRLLDLRATFTEGGISFDVSVGQEWDDANEGDTSIVN